MYHIGGIAMKLPIIVGAGVCKTPASILPYMREDVSVGAVSTGSYTPNLRLGNDGTLFWPADLPEFVKHGFGLNSFGMPNLGFDREAREFHKRYVHPVIASVAGFSVDDYIRGFKTFGALLGIAVIKANVGCGNTGKLPFAYDLDFLRHMLEASKKLKIKKPIWLKLSPYITAHERDELQERYSFLDFSNVPVVESTFISDVLGLIWTYGVLAVVFSNTLANVIFRDAKGNPVTTPFGGKAGLSGRILKPISIRLIRKTAELLPPGTVHRIASGGAVIGDDVVDYLENYADAVCCTSGPFWSGNGPRFHADLISGSERLQKYLTQHAEYLKED